MDLTLCFEIFLKYVEKVSQNATIFYKSEINERKLLIIYNSFPHDFYVGDFFKVQPRVLYLTHLISVTYTLL